MGVPLDLSPEGPEAPPAGSAGDREPGELEMLARGLLGVPRYLERVLRGFPSMLPNLEDTPIIGDVPGAKTVGRSADRNSAP
jgi:diacylglycerol O-acyltransferase / wax synthase